MWPGLGDCAPSGRVRLDALARWLQDIAYADVEDAGLADSAVWVVRRTRMRIVRFPRFAERCTVSTYCSGVGRMWAERRTTIVADKPVGGGIAVEAVALWVHLDEAGRPTPFDQREIALYGDAAVGRRVTARLRQPQPTATAQRSSWTFRATECDLARHINNAAYWQAIEELLLSDDGELTRLDAEMEFRTPSQPGEKIVLRDGDMGWIVGPDGAMHASVVLKPLG
jgi:acyl-ACP thioesterase